MAKRSGKSRELKNLQPYGIGFPPPATPKRARSRRRLEDKLTVALDANRMVNEVVSTARTLRKRRPRATGQEPAEKSIRWPGDGGFDAGGMQSEDDDSDSEWSHNPDSIRYNQSQTTVAPEKPTNSLSENPVRRRNKKSNKITVVVGSTSTKRALRIRAHPRRRSPSPQEAVVDDKENNDLVDIEGLFHPSELRQTRPRIPEAKQLGVRIPKIYRPKSRATSKAADSESTPRASPRLSRAGKINYTPQMAIQAGLESDDSDTDYVDSKPHEESGDEPDSESELTGPPGRPTRSKRGSHLRRSPLRPPSVVGLGSKRRQQPASRRTIKGKQAAPRRLGLDLGSPLAQMRQRVHASTLPDSLPCREDEFKQVYHFVAENIRTGQSSCMYISGVPGTGKTATVRQVIRALEEETSFTFVDINAMQLADPYQIFVEIHKTVCAKRCSSTAASRKLGEFFGATRKKSDHVVLLIDELDLLWTKKQQVLYQIFDWPTCPSARLTILAIANTMDLPERAMILRVSSRLGMARLCFQSYTHDQLVTIIRSRLHGTTGAKSNAIELAARKIAAVSGDARRALELCRRALEVAELSGSKVLGISDITAALAQIHAAPYMKEIRIIIPHKCRGSQDTTEVRCRRWIPQPRGSSGFLDLRRIPDNPEKLTWHASGLEKKFLRACVSEFRRTGIEETNFGKVTELVRAAHVQEELPPPSLAQMCRACDSLSANKLIVARYKAGRRLHRRLRLNVDVEDVKDALKEK